MEREKKRARGERGGAKEKFYAAKRPVQIWNVNVDNIVISKLIKTKANYKYLIGYLDEAIWPLVLIMSRMSGCVKTIKADVFLYQWWQAVKKI